MNRILALLVAFVFSLAVPAFALADVSDAVVTGATVTIGGSTTSDSVSASVSAGMNDSSSTGSEQSAYSGSVINNFVTADVQNDATIPDLSSVSSASVSTDADLSTYAKAVIKGDANVSGVDTSPNKVSVTYNQPAWFLGFIPMTVKVRADAMSDGSITVHYPWYSFLTHTTSDSLKARLQSSVGVANNANASFNAHTEAVLVDSLRSAMKSNLDADTSASASATASGTAGQY